MSAEAVLSDALAQCAGAGATRVNLARSYVDDSNRSTAANDARELRRQKFSRFSDAVATSREGHRAKIRPGRPAPTMAGFARIRLL